jgi:hypothetical protein
MTNLAKVIDTKIEIARNSLTQGMKLDKVSTDVLIAQPLHKKPNYPRHFPRGNARKTP